MEIRRLTLSRFRRFEYFQWHPEPGINCLVGSGDGGKTTILEAIGRATSPAPPGPASEHDYFGRLTEDGFEIELVLGSLPEPLLGAFHPPMCWGWRGPNETLLTAPAEGSEAVMLLRVRGTPDLEIEHRLITPSDEEIPFGSDRRRLLGLCRVGEMRGSSSQFRLARGSLLERHLGREEIRGAATRAVRDASVSLKLPDPVQQRLATLERRLRAEGIVDDPVTLELLSPAGQSLLGLLGLAIGESGSAIPMSLAGQGSQRLTSYVLATELADVPPLFVMDEVEIGLEPYRQRLLMQRLTKLLERGGQAFLTTHSPVVLECLDVDSLYRLQPHLPGDAHASLPATGASEVSSRVTPSPSDAGDQTPSATIHHLGHDIRRVKTDDPEALLCRLPIVCEGTTEVEILFALLEQCASSRGTSLAAMGIRLVDGGGQPHAFPIIRALRDTGYAVGVFLDEDEKHSGLRGELDDWPNVARGFFVSGCCTEAAIADALAVDALDGLLDVTTPEAPRAGVGRRQQVSEELSTQGSRSPSQLLADFPEGAVRAAIGRCAHRHGWFKQRAHARALASWIAADRLPSEMAADVSRFWDATLTLLSVADAE